MQLERSVSDSAMKRSLRFPVVETSLWPTTQQEPKKGPLARAFTKCVARLMLDRRAQP
jgi:hypothetical protein